MLHILKKLSIRKIREIAKSYREAAARNKGYQDTSQSYLRLAEKYDELAREQEVKAAKKPPLQ